MSSTKHPGKCTDDQGMEPSRNTDGTAWNYDPQSRSLSNTH